MKQFTVVTDRYGTHQVTAEGNYHAVQKVWQKLKKKNESFSKSVSDFYNHVVRVGQTGMKINRYYSR